MKCLGLYDPEYLSMKQLPPHPQVDRTAALARASRELNDLVAVKSYDEGRAVASHRPIELYMQIASACNLDCYMCSEHNRPQEWRRGRGATSLPPELFEKVERELFPYARRLTIGVGGEPTISPHFLDYVRRAHATGLDVHVMTNGTRIRNAEAAETLARCTKSMEVSVDAATPETYERIRLGSKWKSLNANLERLVAAIRALPEEERTHLTLCFVLMKSNVHEFPAFVEFGKRIGASRVSGWHIIPVTEEGKTETLQTDRARSNELLKEALRRGEELGVEVDVPALFDLTEAEHDLTGVDLAAGLPEQVSVALASTPVDGVPAGRVDDSVKSDLDEVEYEVVDHPGPEAPRTEPVIVASAPVGAAAAAVAEPAENEATSAVSSPPQAPLEESEASDASERPEHLGRSQGITRESSRHRAGAGRIHCSSPTTAVFLFYDGRVLPCCHPHAHAQMPMGNLWDSSFAEIWNGPMYRNLRAGLHIGDAPPLCQTCSIVHSPPPKVENIDDLLKPGNDLASWYEGRNVSSFGPTPEPSPAIAEHLVRIEDELARTLAHTGVVASHRDALLGHVKNLEAAFRDENGRTTPGLNPGWADEVILERLSWLDSELAQTTVHAETLQSENEALKGHVKNLERMLSKTGAKLLYRLGSKAKDLFGGRKGGQ